MVCLTHMIVLFYLFACLSSILEIENRMLTFYHNVFLSAVQVSSFILFPLGMLPHLVLQLGLNFLYMYVVISYLCAVSPLSSS